ncbi:sodium-dependent transporter [Demetria terragena]|uniref:sodium-dependent transporter n=1 Tax=Demetria terragena TaxID=63959 RepID=UPI000688CAB2|nr:sodium-dependent transporter [Demetria terragena]
MSAVTEDSGKSAAGFASRRVFILAAIGSAVGLGNIWRFPYVAYEGGGGAFIVPYLVAIFVAGLPFLYLDYAMGHRYRGSAPLSFRRMSRGAEGIGWWQVLVCLVIGVYYAAIIAWALRYTIFSFGKSWGSKPDEFFGGDFLHAAAEPGPTLDFVPGLLIPLVIVWVLVLGILALGVQDGIGRTALILMPLLFVAFTALVVFALFLDGAPKGLDALFTPDWSALKQTDVWVAAFGQIFFSLSVGFGVMITYASYVARKTDMTGAGTVVAFSNSGFELLAGIGVFSALGFMAQASGVAVDKVVESGIGLAFIAFPAIINEAPAGALIGVLFFGSLVVAGLTSLVSVIEVVIAGFQDKFNLSRRTATTMVGVPMAIISVLLFSTTGALTVLDTVDSWINSFGILAVAVVSMIVVAHVAKKLPVLADSLNRVSSIRLGTVWRTVIGFITPIALIYLLYKEFSARLDAPYGDYPQSLLIPFGWAVVIVIPIAAFALAALPWRNQDMTNDVEDLETDVETEEEVR